MRVNPAEGSDGAGGIELQQRIGQLMDLTADLCQYLKGGRAAPTAAAGAAPGSSSHEAARLDSSQQAARQGSIRDESVAMLTQAPRRVKSRCGRVRCAGACSAVVGLGMRGMWV